MSPITALVADDEPLLREHLVALLAPLWPGLEVVAQARNGREALAQFELHRPQVVFLDIHMPGSDGLEAAAAIGGRAHLVFVTAHERYAVQAFDHRAVDYLLKPLEVERLRATVQRLQQRLDGPPSPDAATLQPLLERLAQTLQAPAATAPLRWIRASVGATIRLIPTDEVAYLRADDKYTLVAWAGGEALIRTSIRDLVDALDPMKFVQTHRAVIVNRRHVACIVRGPHETAEVHLHGRPETLPVSRAYLWQFR